MMKEPEIRFIQKKDLGALVRLCQLHAIFEKSEYTPENKTHKLSEHLFSDNPSLYCLVVEKENKIIGYATYMKQFSTWGSAFYIYMDCLFLTEESRGFGIGERLMNQIRKEAKKMNCDTIQWQTPDFNIKAMKFYDRIGGVSISKERYFLNVLKDNNRN